MWSEILKIILPAALVFLATYVTMSRFFENEEAKRNFDIKKDNHKTSYPTRLRAYERLILFLERTIPERLIPRVLTSEMPAREFQSVLIKTIREEFEHNLSQQLYVSDEVWNMVSSAKEGLTKLVNMSAASIPQDAGAIELSKKILDAYSSIGEAPTETTIAYLKKEVRTLL